MKKYYVIGINSGTSFDGIDTALASFEQNNLNPKFITGAIYKYPESVKNKIREITESKCYKMPLWEISQLNFLLGELFAEAALKLIKKNNLTSKDILLIGSHGQTIYHHPTKSKFLSTKISSTYQIGEGSVIASKTGITTVSNFREADLASDGEGAPLMPFLDQILFNKRKNITGILNIGGISNITILGGNIKPIAFDIGPGNGLIDTASKELFNIDFDKNGINASKGKIYYKLIDKALKDKYFKIKPPKSTGKEYFNKIFIKKYFSEIKNKYDLIATLTFFTAKSIEHSIFKLLKYNLGELIVSGGGIKNKTLVTHLKTLLPNIEINNSDKYEIPYNYKESILFATLAYACYLKKTGNIPSCTGAKKKTILGKISYV